MAFERRGLRRTVAARHSVELTIAGVIAGILLVLVLVLVLVFILALAFVGLGVTVVGTAAICLYRGPLTAEGSELRDPVDVTSRDERLHLTEHLLPWAVLFGHEREWVKELKRWRIRRRGWRREGARRRRGRRRCLSVVRAAVAEWHDPA